MVAAVGEPSTFHLELSGHLHSLLEINVRVMRMGSQSLDDEVLNALKLGHKMLAHLAQVGDVCEVANTEGIAGEGVVLHLDGLNVKVAEVKRSLIDEMNIVGGSTRIQVFLESIRKLTLDLRKGRLVDEKRHRLVVLAKDERPDIVETSNVVLVLMGNEHRVEMVHPFTEHLLTEVGTGINRHGHLLRANQNRSACALVAGVFRLTHRTLTSDDRNTL